MESRKLQKIGYSTLSVSLPRKWVKKMNLKRGDIVYIDSEREGSLRIFTIDHKPREEIEEYICNSDLTADPKFLERLIVGCYILGGELISIISSNKISSEHIEEIRNIVRQLIGIGIVEETQDSIKLQCSINPKSFHLDIMLRRLSIIALTIVKEAVQALVDQDVSLAKEAIKREEEADTMYFLALRSLVSAQRKSEVAAEIGLNNPLDILYFGLIFKYLELTADYAEEIARRVIELLHGYIDQIPKWVIERIYNLNDLAQDLVTKSIDCFLIGDIKIAHNVLKIQSFIKVERDRMMKEFPEIPHLRLITWNITRIADNGSAIALLAINKTLERKKNNFCTKRLLTSIK